MVTFFMAYVHIAHDCRIGNHVIMANAATLAGHIDIDDFGVGVGASDEGGMHHPRQGDIVRIGAAPRHGTLGAAAGQGSANIAVGAIERGGRWLGVHSGLSLDPVFQCRFDRIDNRVIPGAAAVIT